MSLTRREFTAASLTLLLTQSLRAQSTPHPTVAVMEHDHVLAEAQSALTAPIVTITATTAPLGTPNDFVSQLNSSLDEPTQRESVKLFRAHARALRNFSATVSALAAAYVISNDAPYAQRAGAHLNAWFVDPATRMNPTPNLAGILVIPADTGTPAGVMDLLSLAEVIRASSFILDQSGLPDDAQTTITTWFADFGSWLRTTPFMMLARDTRDHRASAWLLLNSAIARATRNEKNLDDCRRRFLKPTLRNQIVADGNFPQEAATANPYRNTLMNYDLLAAICQLLTSPFDDPWHYELLDGPGMRAVAAYMFPVIADRNKWRYVSDAEGFRELPGRRPALLFAGHAFHQEQYIDLWQHTSPTIPADISFSFPVRQPLLWTARAPHGL
jgi:Alginate lyase